MICRELWGTCLLPIPAPHCHIAWASQGPFLCLLTNWWLPESAIVESARPEERDAPSPAGTPPSLVSTTPSLVSTAPSPASSAPSPAGTRGRATTRQAPGVAGRRARVR